MNQPSRIIRVKTDADNSKHTAVYAPLDIYIESDSPVDIINQFEERLKWECERIYDEICLPDNNITEEQEQIASDVLAGMYVIISTYNKK